LIMKFGPGDILLSLNIKHDIQFCKYYTEHVSSRFIQFYSMLKTMLMM